MNTTNTNRLKTLRTAAGLTQQQLAKKAGIHCRTVQKLESGEREIDKMTLETAINLCAALNIQIKDLLK